MRRRSPVTPGNVREIRVSNPEQLVHIVQNIVDGPLPNHHVVVLFSEEPSSLHDDFLDGFVRSRDPRDLVLLVKGETMVDRPSLWRAWRRALPWGGDISTPNESLDGFADSLWHHGVLEDPGQSSFWIWRHADTLYQRDTRFFAQVFSVMVDVALQAAREYQSKSREDALRAKILLTGSWESMKGAASNETSFLYRLSNVEQEPNRGIQLVTLRVLR